MYDARDARARLRRMPGSSSSRTESGFRLMTQRKTPTENFSSTLPWWEEILRGQKSGLFAESVRRAAQVGSWGYRMGVRGRELAYETGLLRIKRLPRPTICIGN